VSEPVVVIIFSKNREFYVFESELLKKYITFLHFMLAIQATAWWDEIKDVYQEAIKLDRIKSVSLGNHNFAYAMLSSKADFSGSAKRFIRWWGPLWIGRRYEGKNYVFCDCIPDELQDQIGLHESLHDLVEDGDFSHKIACREELKFLEQNPDLYIKYETFWIGWEKGKEILRKKYRTVDKSYFSDEIPDLDRIIREGKLKPGELLRLYQDTLNRKYGHIEVEF